MSNGFPDFVNGFLKKFCDIFPEKSLNFLPPLQR